MRGRDLNGWAGCVQLSRARSTGTLVGIYKGAEAGMDTNEGTDDPLPYTTLCETHGNLVAHPSLTLARSHASQPEEWCEECRHLPCPCGGHRQFVAVEADGTASYTCPRCGDEFVRYNAEVGA